MESAINIHENMMKIVGPLIGKDPEGRYCAFVRKPSEMIAILTNLCDTNDVLLEGLQRPLYDEKTGELIMWFYDEDNNPITEEAFKSKLTDQQEVHKERMNQLIDAINTCNDQIKVLAINCGNGTTARNVYDYISEKGLKRYPNLKNDRLVS